MVKLDVRVLERHGDFVSGLTRSDFRVLDNGNEKPVLFFAPVDAPVRVVVLVETSPAVYLIHEEHMVALATLLDGLGPADQAALVGYDQSPRSILPFTSDEKALLNALGDAQFRIGRGDLNFYDSLRGVLDWLGDSPDKKAIVLLTTGLDSSPPDRWDALDQKLRQQNVVIYSVALGGPLRGTALTPPKGLKKTKRGAQNAPSPHTQGASAFARADQALLSIAEITGGGTYFPQSAEDFAPAYREIASALRHEYVLGISPDHDGTRHALTVQVLDRNRQPPKAGDKNPAFRTFCREGYLAPAP